MEHSGNTKSAGGLTLVLGATGKTGQRVAAGLEATDVPVRHGSRSAVPAFDWNREAGWDACLEGVEAAYVTYAPDLALPGATDAIRAFVGRAERHGLRRLFLLVTIPHEAFVAGVRNSGAPQEVVWMLDYLFATVLDGRNAHLTDGVERALGRPAKGFSEFAREIAATGLWSATA